MKAQSEQTQNRSWKWLRFWQNCRSDEDLGTTTDIEREPLMGRHLRPSVPKVVVEPDAEGQHPTRLNTVLRGKKVKAGVYKRLFQVFRALKRDDG